jgi:hypothetical protein
MLGKPVTTYKAILMILEGIVQPEKRDLRVVPVQSL